ncbi:helix-turn-helix transcriptional regulator [Clostridium sp. JN-9]|uniref:helix-turn-helix domain-containing protein n=1 Tax=Clostridium sp. JN-9 TaxID=2507159 RepID=UPI000FFE07A0|nr:helix-turn-helix transcriptional regulator [Clostridium sp. JN-9]QAT39831.1 XRE family transcriptional regulator [Clostridium sp. JN-9]
MKENIKFSESLSFLLSTLDISISRLAKAINVDSSLVNRWVNGKRVPSYKTNYINNISDYLSGNVQNSFQKKYINDFYYRIFNDNIIEDDMEERIKKILAESQGYSIELRKMELTKSKPKSADKEQSSNSKQFISLSKQDQLIIGSKNVISKSLSLLEAAANTKCKNNNTIFISFINDICFMKRDSNNLIYCRKILLRAISNGWNILFLLRLDNNCKRTMEFINFSKLLVKTGKLNLYYLSNYDALNTGKDIIAIPEIGAIFTISTTNHLENERAFFFKSIEAIDTCQKYFRTLLKSYAKPAIKYYSTDNNLEYSEFLSRMKSRMGNRFLCRYGFNIITIPENLFKKLLNRKKLTSSRLTKELNCYKKKLYSFVSNIDKYEYWDIYQMDSIENLIDHGELCFYSYSGMEIVHLEPEDIIEYLQNLIKLLEMYKNYNVGFLTENSDKDLIYFDFCCIIKERQAALIESYGTSKFTPEVRLSIEEPMLVKALSEHFKDIWSHIPPVNKDKMEIINWIKYQIKLLKSSHN